jgi:hypothetical protein
MICLLWSAPAWAGQLADRVAAFPNWTTKPIVDRAINDLVYPNWLEGTWRVESTLLDLVAPLAPEIITPGFESNRELLNQAIEFDVRFKKQAHQDVIVDRAFNGLNIARAYLGDRAVLAVKVDPNSPNKQITLLRDDRKLTSTITGRASESPSADKFITTEIFQQVFRGTAQPYLNQVETTTSYQRSIEKTPAIEADQITAIYLSPQDPNYFTAGEAPVALYRYHLIFHPIDIPDLQSE